MEILELLPLKVHPITETLLRNVILQFKLITFETGGFHKMYIYDCS